MKTLQKNRDLRLSRCNLLIQNGQALGAEHPHLKGSGGVGWHSRCSPERRDLVISLTRAAARAKGCAVFLAVSCRHASRWSGGPRRSALEFHTPLCHRYKNFDIVHFFVWRWPLLIGRQRGSSALL
jgi:hypothetical protein